MRVGRKSLRCAWDSARDHAGLDRRDCVVFFVKARMPDGRAEASYYRPGRPDMPHEWLIPSILRLVPPDVLERYESRHRVAIWAEIPRAPYSLLDPLIRHELEHAVQWQHHGRAYTDLDGFLRELWDARANTERYLSLPSEREANLASAAYAGEVLDEERLGRLRRKSRYRHLVDFQAPARETDALTLMVEALRGAGDKFLPQFSAKE